MLKFKFIEISERISQEQMDVASCEGPVWSPQGRQDESTEVTFTFKL